MSIFDGVFQNKAIMNAALGKLGGLIKSEGLEFIIVSVDPEDGGILIKMTKPGDVTIVENKPAETSKPEATLAALPESNISPVKPDTDANDQNSKP